MTTFRNSTVNRLPRGTLYDTHVLPPTVLMEGQSRHRPAAPQKQPPLDVRPPLPGGVFTMPSSGGTLAPKAQIQKTEDIASFGSTKIQPKREINVNQFKDQNTSVSSLIQPKNEPQDRKPARLAPSNIEKMIAAGLPRPAARENKNPQSQDLNVETSDVAPGIIANENSKSIPTDFLKQETALLEGKLESIITDNKQDQQLKRINEQPPTPAIEPKKDLEIIPASFSLLNSEKRAEPVNVVVCRLPLRETFSHACVLPSGTHAPRMVLDATITREGEDKFACLVCMISKNEKKINLKQRTVVFPLKESEEHAGMFSEMDISNTDLETENQLEILEEGQVYSLTILDTAGRQIDSRCVSGILRTVIQ